MHKSVIFREYDIRGVVGKDFDAEFAQHLGQGFATFLKSKGAKDLVVTVGHDARLSSPELCESLTRGLQMSGARVVQLGLVTTPISYFSMFHVPGATGGVMITGSHNPPEYNGFKISAGKSTIFGAEIQQLGRIVDAKNFGSGSGSVEKYDIFPDYIDRYKKEFGTLPDVNVAIDCGNGAAGCILNRLYTALGLKPKILFEKPDGTFPNHHPDPTVEENLVDLKEAVSIHKAQLGIGFDGDADRIGVVDGNGRTIMGDELMVLVSRDILKRSPGSKIIGDVKCSDRLFADIEKHGGKAIMWKTGHSLVKNKIKEEHAPFGGELSGHIFFADRNYGFDDALYAGLRLIEIVGKTNKSISQLLADLPQAWSTPEIRIDTTEEKKTQIVNKLRDIYSKPSDRYKTNLIDGIRISFKDGWALARASNTQPVLVLRFESSTEAGLKRIRSEIEEHVNPLL